MCLCVCVCLFVRRWIIATLASLLLLPPVLADASTLGLSVATNFAIMSTKMGDEPADDRVSVCMCMYDTSLPRVALCTWGRVAHLRCGLGGGHAELVRCAV